MSYLYEDVEREHLAGAGIEPLWAGTITDTAIAVTDLLHVKLPGQDDATLFGPCRWPTRVAELIIDVSQSPEVAKIFTVAQLVYPQAGDHCLVAFDEQQRPWIVSWYPAAWGI